MKYMEIDELEEKLKEQLKQIQAMKKNSNKKPKKTNKKTTTTKPKTQPKKQPEQPYSAIPEILNTLSFDEMVKRFGILWDKKTPYKELSGKSIEQFYKDKNIKVFRIWYMSYANKDIILDTQMKKKSAKIQTDNINNRINEIQTKLDTKPKNITNVNHLEKREQSLIKQMEKLEEY